MAKGFKVADAYVEVNIDDNAAKRAVRDLDKTLGPEAEKVGSNTGKRVSKGLGDEVEKGGTEAGKRGGQGLGKGFDSQRPKTEKAGSDQAGFFSKAFSLSFLKNAPLITAAVGGALIAGAPLMIGAAGVLFGGLGAVIAFQNDNIKAQYKSLWEHVKDGATQSAASMIPVMSRIDVSLTNTFDKIQPLLTRAFAGSGPLLEKLVGGVERFATGSMPGMVHAIEAGGPVFDGLSNFLGEVGTGLGHFFDLIAQHGPASGSVFSALGSIVSSLLSILGDLSSQGAELGGVVLPMVASALGVVADALHVIAPVLPIVVAGFSAFKLAGTAAGLLGTFGKQLSFVSGVAGPLEGVLSKAGSTISSVAGALPFVGTAVAVVGAAMEMSKQQVDGWATSILKGGTAAETATAQMHKQDAAVKDMTTGWRGWLTSLAPAGSTFGIIANQSAKVTSEVQKQLAAMDPLTRAQTLQTQASNDLSTAIEKYGPASDQALSAANRYGQYSAEVTRLKNEEQRAIQGVTDAMVAEADEEDARANSSIAYRQSVLNTRDAQLKLLDAQKHLHDQNPKTRTSTEQLAQAQIDAEKAMLKEAEAAGKLASDALPASVDGHQKAAIAAEASLKELDKLAAMYGGKLPPNLEAYRQGLLRQVGTVDLAKVKTDIAKAALDKLGATKAVPSVALQGVPQATQDTHYVMDNMSKMGGMRPAPVVTLKDYASTPLGYVEQQLNYVNGYHAVATVTTYYSSQGSAPTTAGRNFLYGNAGGPIKRGIGGPISGPGGPTDDKVPAFSEGGQPYLLSPREWIINAAVSNKQGDRKMTALNEGKASIVPDANPTTGTGITVGNLTVAISGSFDFSDPTAARKAAVAIRDELVKLERSYR